MVRRLLWTGVLCLGTLSVPAAGYSCNPVAFCTYKSVVLREAITTCVSRLVPCTLAVTRYDTCGRAYSIKKTSFRTVTIPTTKTIAVSELANIAH
jgi:hypothetical protein